MKHGVSMILPKKKKEYGGERMLDDFPMELHDGSGKVSADLEPDRE